MDLLIRTGKEIDRNLFSVNLVRLTEALRRDRKCGIGLVGGYGAVGGRVCNWHQHIFNLMSYLMFYIIVMRLLYI